MRFTHKTGCPFCGGGQSSFSTSGAEPNVGRIFLDGYARIGERQDDPSIAPRPTERTIQCTKCDAIWVIKYMWPDRPPCIAQGTVKIT